MIKASTIRHQGSRENFMPALVFPGPGFWIDALF
jgi:hypothetical protein